MVIPLLASLVGGEMRYAGVGSRETPPEILETMTAIASDLDGWGWKLRSGGAKGADTAFAAGSTNSTIYRPYPVKSCPEAIILPKEVLSVFEGIVNEFHPAWEACNHWARALHARNVAILIGANGQAPVDLVIAWTKDGEFVGGTATCLRMAQHYGIPIMNLATYDSRESLVKNIKTSKIDCHGTLIDRSTVFGNPFKVNGSRRESIEKHKKWLLNKIREDGYTAIPLLASLRGRDLYCHCAPQSCHGLFLREMANMIDWPK